MVEKKKMLSESFVKRFMKLGGVETLSERFLKEEGEFPTPPEEEEGENDGELAPEAPPETPAPGDEKMGGLDVDAADDTVTFGPEEMEKLAGNVAAKLSSLLKDVAAQAGDSEESGDDLDMGDDLEPVEEPMDEEDPEMGEGMADEPRTGEDLGGEPGPSGEPTKPTFNDDEDMDRYQESLKKNLVEEIFKRVMKNLNKKA